MFSPNPGDTGSSLVLGKTQCSSLSCLPEHGSDFQGCARLRALTSPTCTNRQSWQDLLWGALSTSVTAAFQGCAGASGDGPGMKAIMGVIYLWDVTLIAGCAHSLLVLMERAAGTGSPCTPWVWLFLKNCNLVSF